jgi:succinoglycan biosynthesis protein ExoL
MSASEQASLDAVYFVHDLSDPAVHRRVRMLRAESENIALIGFRRGPVRQENVAGVVPMELGRTRNGWLVRRIGSILWAALLLPRMRKVATGRTLFIARTLEMLVLAYLVRLRYAPSAALVYECLDVHRLMTSRTGAGVALRVVERSLMSRCAMLVTSSPGFIREYFAPAYRHQLPPVWLMENRVLASELAPSVFTSRERMHVSHGTGGPPWRIGWFGVLRCRRSLQILAAVARRLPGQVEIVIRGRPARDAVPDFDDLTASTPGLFFGGPYDRVLDLAAIYGGVHFVWAIDYYDGESSDLLLPNRLYEGLLYGAVPLALAQAETGRWLYERRCGIAVSERVEEDVVKYFAGLDAEKYSEARCAVAQVPISHLVAGPEVCAEFAAALSALHAGHGS